MNTRNTSATTTGMAVGDSESARIAAVTLAQGAAENASGGVKAVPASADKNAMAVGETNGVRPIVVKDVDSTVLAGSHKSGSDDVSSKFSTDAFKNQAGPRGETTDTPEAGA